MVNKAILLGFIGKDPELKYMPSGKAVTTFSMATSNKWTGKDGQKHDETTWHNIVAWDKQAETIKEYMAKGSRIFIEGRIDNYTYDKKDGSGKGYGSQVIVQSFQFMGDKPSVEGGESKPMPASEEKNVPDLPF